jgi:hypothetical protein
LQKIFLATLIVVLVALPLATVNRVSASNPPMISPPLASQNQKTAVILSSLDQVYPMGQYRKDMVYYLTHAGYEVTSLNNTAVTLDFLLTQLNNYQIVIWRTNTYTWKHIEYWYVGELANSGVETKYASDFALGYINGNAGILGINLNFFTEHFTAGTLNKVKLMFLISTDSESFASIFNSAGATTVIFANGAIGLGFGEIDDLTNQVLGNMAAGQNVYSAVYGAVSPFVQNSNPEDPLDTSYTPPFWYQGDGTLTL